MQRVEIRAAALRGHNRKRCRYLLARFFLLNEFISGLLRCTVPVEALLSFKRASLSRCTTSAR